jgi:hypothetical protein
VIHRIGQAVRIAAGIAFGLMIALAYRERELWIDIRLRAPTDANPSVLIRTDPDEPAWLG